MPEIGKVENFLIINRYRRIRPKVDAKIFDSALSHTRRSDASEKKKKMLASTFERFRLLTSFESSLVSVKATHSPVTVKLSEKEP